MEPCQKSQKLLDPEVYTCLTCKMGRAPVISVIIDSPVGGVSCGPENRPASVVSDQWGRSLYCLPRVRLSLRYSWLLLFATKQIDRKMSTNLYLFQWQTQQRNPSLRTLLTSLEEQFLHAACFFCVTYQPNCEILPVLHTCKIRCLLQFACGSSRPTYTASPDSLSAGREIEIFYWCQ